MELFQKAKTIRLRSYRDKYLTAEDDEENVIQDRDGSTKNSIWTVEFVPGRDVVRFVSCYGKYLTASNMPLVPRMPGRKVIQTLPNCRDPRIDWEPIRDGFQVKLKTLWGNFLRPNGGVPPWRNCITHDIPHFSTTSNKILWDVEVVETRPIPAALKNHKRTHSDFTFDRSRSRSAASSSFMSHQPNAMN
ncbi:unnamed protein product [Coffea canephora]|uniref:DUF569 domain-containing protein n=1 Tax=Coffea canephora TaxID=49390 RepID=A0A068VDW8_COFCA|nr:unnamed protein product [Coffea canephora]